MTARLITTAVAAALFAFTALADEPAAKDKPAAKPEEKFPWVALDISAACNMDIISTAEHTAADGLDVVFEPWSVATKSLIQKLGATQAGLPDDGRVDIPKSDPKGQFQVLLPPLKNAIVLTDKTGRQPDVVTVEISSTQQRKYSRLTFLHAGTWGDGTVSVVLHYDSGDDEVIRLEIRDWRAEARTMPKDVAVAVTTRTYSSKSNLFTTFDAELLAETFSIDPKRSLRSIIFAVTSRSATIAEQGGFDPKTRNSAGKFTVGIFAISALPAEEGK